MILKHNTHRQTQQPTQQRQEETNITARSKSCTKNKITQTTQHTPKRRGGILAKNKTKITAHTHAQNTHNKHENNTTNKQHLDTKTSTQRQSLVK